MITTIRSSQLKAKCASLMIDGYGRSRAQGRAFRLNSKQNAAKRFRRQAAASLWNLSRGVKGCRRRALRVFTSGWFSGLVWRRRQRRQFDRCSPFFPGTAVAVSTLKIFGDMITSQKIVPEGSEIVFRVCNRRRHVENGRPVNVFYGMFFEGPDGLLDLLRPCVVGWSYVRDRGGIVQVK